jgi:anti-anti-sigma regulatory factor
MLRITTVTTKDETAIKLEGKLARAWVDEVEQTWHTVARDNSRVPILVDLCGVTFIDAEGKKLLIRMSGEGVLFRCCGPDITATVEAAKREASSDPSSRPQHL